MFADITSSDAHLKAIQDYMKNLHAQVANGGTPPP